MTLLTMRLLGAPHVSFGGEPLHFRSRKVLALLIYLVVEGGQHERDKLADLFWPESDQQQGRTSLRITLARLRQSLAAAGDLIRSEGSRIGFAGDQPFDLDLQTLDAVADTLSAETPVDTLERVIARIQGEFLEGFALPDAPDFERWAGGQREWCYRRADELYAGLGRRQLAGGHFAAAVATAARWTQYTPFSESAHRCLIEAHALCGNRTAALQAYASCQQILADELGVAPSPETTALAERVRMNQVTTTPRSPAARAAAGTADAPQPLVIPLVGRSAEFDRLTALYRQAAQGRLQAAAIVGEAGMGKSRLAETLLAWATLATPPADLLRGRAYEIGGHLPYQPVVDALRQRLERENAPDDLLDDIWLAELSQLLPELRSRYPDLPLPMSGNAEFVQARLFEAVALLGMALAARQPLLLFIDDLQWADSGSRDLLHYLARRWSAQQTPALLLLTVRQEGLLTMPELREWLFALGRDVRCTRLELSPLPPTALTALAHALTNDRAAGDQFGDWLATETDGSPFFVAELLQFLRQQAILVVERQASGTQSVDLAATLAQLHESGRISLPPTVRDLILRRLDRLSEKANTLLLAGSVLGRRATFEQLCQVARLDEFDGLPALEELLQNRLMVEAPHDARPFSFAHDNIRDVAYTEAGATRRRLYHRQAFLTLEQAQEPAAELASHAALAGLHQPAFTYALAAGDEALALHAFADAAGFYEQALQVADRLEVAAAQAAHLCTQYGRALELSGRYQDALNYYMKTATTARAIDNRPLELAALLGHGTIRATANELCDFALGETLGQEALTLARALDDKAAEAKIQWNLLNVYRLTDRHHQAKVAGERSLALARELNLREQMAYAANDLMHVYQHEADLQRGTASAHTAIALWRELGNQPMLTDGLTNLTFALTIAGDYAGARPLVEEALQVSRLLENKWATAYSLMAQSLIDWQTMNVDAALRALHESIQLAEAIGFTGPQAIGRSYEANVRLALGDVTTARRLAETAAAIAATNLPIYMPGMQGVLALVALADEEVSEAERIIADGSLQELPLSFLYSGPLEWAVFTHALKRGDLEEAYNYSTRHLSAVVAQKSEIYLADCYYMQGQALQGLGRLAEARAALTTALTTLRANGGRWHYCAIAAMLADLEDQAGNAVVAATIRREARTVLDFILDHIAEERLRASFLALPHVSSLLAHQ